MTAQYRAPTRDPYRCLLLAVIEQAVRESRGAGIVSNGKHDNPRTYRARVQAEAREWLRTETAAYLAELAGVDISRVPVRPDEPRKRHGGGRARKAVAG